MTLVYKGDRDNKGWKWVIFVMLLLWWFCYLMPWNGVFYSLIKSICALQLMCFIPWNVLGYPSIRSICALWLMFCFMPWICCDLFLGMLWFTPWLDIVTYDLQFLFFMPWNCYLFLPLIRSICLAVDFVIYSSEYCDLPLD